MDEEHVESFWQWSSYSDYLLFVVALAAFTCSVTIYFGEDKTYQYLIGSASSGVEAILGAPQFYLNYKRQNTSGLS